MIINEETTPPYLWALLVIQIVALGLEPVVLD